MDVFASINIIQDVKMGLELKGQIDISIIIPLYRGKKYCKYLLEMIQRNNSYQDLYKKCGVEVIFVNDYPEEEVQIWDNDYKFQIKLISHERNIGIHGARISGILNAKGKYIILLDQDDLITEDWLYSQRKKIISEDADLCVCNGWMGRFRVIDDGLALEKKVNCLDYFIKKGNGILSPGQVIMRKEVIPSEWMTNIQRRNGADDYLLWLMLLKKGYTFVVNNNYLYYHTPERTRDSIENFKMIESLKETLEILRKTNYLDGEEYKKFEQHILERTSSLSYKFRDMFFIMYNWMKLRNQGISLAGYLYSQGYSKVAIHGMGYIGECIYQDLCETNIQVIYAIDCRAIDFKKKLKIIRMEDTFEDVDLIMTTVTEDIQEIIEILKKKCKCAVIGFSQLLIDLRDSILES